MSLSGLMLAQMDPTKELLNNRPSRFLSFDMTDTLVILGFLFLLVVALFSWAYFLRKRPKQSEGTRALVRPARSRRSRRSRHGRRPHHTPPPVAGEESGRRVRVRRRRRRSEEHMPRNPTLGETGGLPPLRPDESEQSPPSPPSPPASGP